MASNKRFQKQVATGRFTLPSAILLAVLMWLAGILLLPALPEVPQGSHLWNLLMPETMPVWLSRLLSFLLYSTIGYFLIGLNNRFAFIRMRASVQTSLYFLLAAACPCTHQFHAGEVAAIAFLITLYFLFSSYQQQRPEADLFNAFFFLGVGSLVFTQLTLLVPVCWIGAYKFRSLQLRSFCASVLGWALPYLLLLGYAFYVQEMELFYLPFRELADFQPLSFSLRPWEVVTAAYLLLLFVVSAVHSQVMSFDDKIRTRSYLNFLSLVTLLLFLLLFLQPGLYPHVFSLLLAGISILVGHLFMLGNSRSSNLFFIGALAGLLLLYFFNLWTLLP